MMAKKRVEYEYCDNPECDFREEIDSDTPGATGFHFGRGFYVLAGGGPIPPFYAHSAECIVPAMEAVLTESEGRH